MAHSIADTRYRPICFFSLSLPIPWALWFIAAQISHMPGQENSPWLAVLMLAGLFVPVFLALWLVWRNPVLRTDTRPRILRLSGFPKRCLLAAVLLPPVSLVLAQLVSLLFGHSLDQFHISGNPSFTSAILSPWLMPALAAVVEELAWHSYGTDALLSCFSLFAASLIFTVYWALWHLPLGFIKGYYHSEAGRLGRALYRQFRGQYGGVRVADELGVYEKRPQYCRGRAVPSFGQSGQ